MFLCFCVFVFWTLISIRQVDEECWSSEREEKLILASLCIWKAIFWQKYCKPLLSFLVIITLYVYFIMLWCKTEIVELEQLSWVESSGVWWTLKMVLEMSGFVASWGKENSRLLMVALYHCQKWMCVCVSKVCLVEFFFANCIYILLWMSEIMKEVENARAKAYLILYAGNMKKKVIWKRNDGLWCKFGKMVKALPCRDVWRIVRYLVFLFLLQIGKHFGLYCLPGRDTGRHWECFLVGFFCTFALFLYLCTFVFLGQCNLTQMLPVPAGRNVGRGLAKHCPEATTTRPLATRDWRVVVFDFGTGSGRVVTKSSGSGTGRDG